VPGTYRGSTDAASVNPDAKQSEQPMPVKTEQPVASLGDAKWWDVFKDEQLQGLIRTALKNNYDVRIAATRVLQAQAQLGITRANQYPTVGATANVNGTRYPQTIISKPYEYTSGQVALTAAWELDF